MRIAVLRAISILSLLWLIIAIAAPTRASTVPVNFTGTEQNFDATVDVSGNLNAVGSGDVWNASANAFQPFKLTAPVDHPLSLAGGAIIAKSDPKTDPQGTTVDITAGTLLDINGLDIDFLNGQTFDFKIDRISLTTNSTAPLLKVFIGSVDLSGALSQLRFDQTGDAIVIGKAGAGTFAIDGDIGATFSNLNIGLGALYVFPIEDKAVSLPTTLTGMWEVSGPLNNMKLSLDGSLSVDIPLELESNLIIDNTDILTLTFFSTLDLAGSLTVAFNYHLEDTLQYYYFPEPGSIVLLGIGLCAAVVPLARRLRSKWHA